MLSDINYVIVQFKQKREIYRMRKKKKNQWYQNFIQSRQVWYIQIIMLNDQILYLLSFQHLFYKLSYEHWYIHCTRKTQWKVTESNMIFSKVIKIPCSKDKRSECIPLSTTKVVIVPRHIEAGTFRTLSTVVNRELHEFFRVITWQSTWIGRIKCGWYWRSDQWERARQRQGTAHKFNS